MPVLACVFCDAVSALHMYSSIDIFGDKEKDRETHITEIRYFSGDLHGHFYESFVFGKCLADGYMMEKKVACRRGSYIYFLGLECCQNAALHHYAMQPKRYV